MQLFGVSLTLHRSTNPSVEDDEYVATKDGKELGTIQISRYGARKHYSAVKHLPDRKIQFGKEQPTLWMAVGDLIGLNEEVITTR